MFCWSRLTLCIFFGVHCLTLTFATASDEDKIIRLLVLLPQTGPGQYKFPFGAEMCGSAVESAFDQIQDDQLLPGYQLVAEYGNTRCRAPQGLGTAHEMMKRTNYTAVIGPQCAEVCRHVAKLTAYLNIPTFSGLCQDVEMEDKGVFKTLTRFIGTFDMTSDAVVQLLRQFGWNRVGIIAEKLTDLIWYHTQLGLNYGFEQSNVTIASSVLYDNQAGMVLETVLLETAAVSRIMVIAVPGATFRKILKLALKHGLLDGNRIIININYYKQRKKFGDFDWNQGLADDLEVKQAYPSIFFLNFFIRDVNDEYLRFVSDVKNGSAENFGYFYDQDENVPYPAANLYEASYLLAVALNETLREGGDITDGQKVAKKIWGRSFTSLTGSLTLNSNGDRDQDYMYTHMTDYNNGEQQLIATYRFGDSLKMTINRISWPSGETLPPIDTPLCGFQGEICAQANYESVLRLIQILVGVIAGVLILTFIIVTLVVRKLRFEKALADMRWKLNYNDIVFDNAKGSKIRSQLSTGSQISKFSAISLKSLVAGENHDHTFTKTANFQGLTVALRHIKHINDPQAYISNKDFLTSMKMIHDLSHPNVSKFIGITMEIPHVYIVTEYCVKGSLQDLLQNDDIQLDWAFKCSLINDIIQGLCYLHISKLKAHGNLKSTNCVVDGRFVVKLTDFGLHNWYRHPAIKSKDLLWTPPECFKGDLLTEPADAHGDVYSLGIILQEICHREGPFYLPDTFLDPEEIIRLVRSDTSPPLRPHMDPTQHPKDVCHVVQKCWHIFPEERPTLSTIVKVLKDSRGIGQKESMNLMDNLLNRMEQYANNLEELVEERTGKYLDEKKRAEDLLHRLLPESIANEIQLKGRVDPQSYDCVSIYFSDIVHFTALCSESTPLQVVDMLNDLYTLFDSKIADHDVYKVETIGDAYMAVSGLPQQNGEKHVTEICHMALTLLSSVKTFRLRHKADRQILLRIGIHSGPCVAGVVGLTMPRYCLFGDTVNTASRMESNGEPLKIHISDSTNELLLDTEQFQTEYRGEVPMKGKGNMRTYWLLEGPAAK